METKIGKEKKMKRGKKGKLKRKWKRLYREGEKKEKGQRGVGWKGKEGNWSSYLVEHIVAPLHAVDRYAFRVFVGYYA